MCKEHLDARSVSMEDSGFSFGLIQWWSARSAPLEPGNQMIQRIDRT